jgi:hypothetical protein
VAFGSRVEQSHSILGVAWFARKEQSHPRTGNISLRFRTTPLQKNDRIRPLTLSTSLPSVMPTRLPVVVLPC